MAQHHIPGPKRESKEETASKQEKVSQSDISPVEKQMPTGRLTPDNILQLQRTLGNAYVVNMVQGKQPTGDSSITKLSMGKSSIQRVVTGATRSSHDQENTLDDSGVNDGVGLVAGMMATDPNKGLAGFGGENGTGNALTGFGTNGKIVNAGAGISIGTGTIGMAIGIYNLNENRIAYFDAKKDLAAAKAGYDDDQMPGHKELFATVKLLENKRFDAKVGALENTGNITGGISGFVGGILTITEAAKAAAVFGAISAGLSAVVGTIAAIRDGIDASQRMKNKSEVSKLTKAYDQLAQPFTDKLNNLHGENEQNLAASNQLKTENIGLREQKVEKAGEAYEKTQELKAEESKKKPDENLKKQIQANIDALQQDQQDLDKDIAANEEKVTQLTAQIANRKQDIVKAEEGYEEYGGMALALSKGEDKQDFVSKIGTGVTNLVSASGGAALLAATLGAGAAAGPVGWILTAVALVALMSYALGSYITRKVRDANVKRMTAERTEITDYIESGTSGNTPKDYKSSDNEIERRNDLWYRSMFPAAQMQSKWSRLFSKTRDGKITMAQRLEMIDKYLGKHDNTQGNTIVEGFISVFSDAAKGSQLVDNPAYVDGKTDPNQKQVKLVDLHMGLLAHFFGDKADEMKESLLSSDDQRSAKAKELLKKKLNLGD